MLLDVGIERNDTAYAYIMQVQIVNIYFKESKVKIFNQLCQVKKDRRGQSLVEYGILVGGVALVCLAAVAILGHKSNDLVATCAAVLPCAHEDDTGPIVSGKLVQTTKNADGEISLSANSGTITTNLGIADIELLVVEAE